MFICSAYANNFSHVARVVLYPSLSRNAVSTSIQLFCKQITTVENTKITLMELIFSSPARRWKPANVKTYRIRWRRPAMQSCTSMNGINWTRCKGKSRNICPYKCKISEDIRRDRDAINLIRIIWAASKAIIKRRKQNTHEPNIVTSSFMKS